ncbi:hypothetical protein ABS767_11765 [Sphingomonas sp. ST-64]|uniref:TonB-dependent receptor n=1 Tax=Sphingomonas plantiphila TaxID=3163295 RepID=A0ABW8YQA6_9SPHN
MPRLDTQFAHLGLNATATVEPPFEGVPWYAGYEQRHAADGIEGRLVSQYSFTESWEFRGHGNSGDTIPNYACTNSGDTILNFAYAAA